MKLYCVLLIRICVLVFLIRILLVENLEEWLEFYGLRVEGIERKRVIIFFERVNILMLNVKYWVRRLKIEIFRDRAISLYEGWYFEFLGYLGFE